MCGRKHHTLFHFPFSIFHFPISNFQFHFQKLTPLSNPMARLQKPKPRKLSPLPAPNPHPHDHRHLLDWARHFLPDHFTLPPSPLHHWLADRLDTLHLRRGAKINCLGPRGSAKSTLVTLAYVLRVATTAREKYIWVVSDTKPQAHAHLENIAQELTQNDRLARVYGDLRGPSWRQDRLLLRNGVAIEALGAGQRIRGRRRRADRPTLIIADDLQSERQVESAFQRQKALDWFNSALIPAGAPHTNFIHLATALHREAIALHLARAPGWDSRTFQSILNWPQNLQLWHDWERLYCDIENPRRHGDARAFYETHREALHAGAQVLWPEREDLLALMTLQVETGRCAFAREKQSTPINPELCEWPEDYFGPEIWFDDWPTSSQVKILALDPSKGRDAKFGDYSAYVKLLVDRHGLYYVQADLARRATPQMVADGVALCRQFQPTLFGVEAVQYQELLVGEFAAELRRQSITGLQPVPIENTENKTIRIRRIGPLLATRRLRFKAHCPGTKKLIEQLQDFPLADHDDAPDALEMALRLAHQLLQGRAPADNLGPQFPISV
jgi:predicted phage terminase large subunit-like protein